MFRGRNEGFLQLNLNVDPGQEQNTTSSAEQIIFDHFDLRLSSQAGAAVFNESRTLDLESKIESEPRNWVVGQPTRTVRSRSD